MKTTKNLYRFLSIVLVLLITSCNDDDDVLSQQLSENPQNISEIIAGNSELSTLSSALVQVGLDSILSTTTTYTVFAPNNDSFSGVDVSALTEEQLTNVLLNHVLSTVTPDFISTMSTGYLTSMAAGPGETNLSFYTNTSAGVTLNGMGAVVDNSSDFGATNGILHVVDGVLMPPTIVDHALANPDYNSFAQAIELAGLTDVLSDSDPDSDNYPFTLFAPNNAAMEYLMTQLNGAFGYSTLADIPVDVLQEIIQYHVIAGANTLAEDVDGTSQTSMQGESFSISGTVIDDASYNNGNIILTDVQGVNGIVHGTDKVLLPNTIFQDILGATLNIVERCDDRGFTSFLAAVEKAGMTDILATTEDLTLFAPNNDAFIALFLLTNNFESLDDFDTPEDIQLLTDLLNYHLYNGQLMVGDLVNDSSITTIYGDTFTVDLTGDNPRLKPSFADAIPSGLVNGNIGATNGIVHEINRVMIPDALLSNLGIDTGGCDGPHPVGDTDLVFFDWDGKDQYWGNLTTENDPAHSLDGSNYARANFQTGGTGWQDLFWRNGSTMNGQDIVGTNINDYVLKFDIKTITPLTAGQFRIRFHSDAIDSFYDWAPWNDTGEPLDTEGGWISVEIPLSVMAQTDYAAVNQEFGMAFEGADVLLNFAIDNVRFDAPGYSCGGPDPVDNTDLVFFDWDGKDQYWGNLTIENDPAHTLDGSNYGRANFSTGGTGWQDLFWRNGSTMNGQDIVGTNINDYVLKFDIKTITPLTAGQFRIRFHSDAIDSFYDWAPWNDTGEPLDTEGGWITVEIPLSVMAQTDYAAVNQEFGMAFEGADVLLNFAIDNVRFEAN
ncbi:Uncaracterized surface protein containing fasciclin (FAS1) repeats [Flaviramulus basaltis]|uniref:Uncaracterized surface protein containing fasciclin (FAS1) repeats n=1 Tax=Flaviramulus basaltis TaxID=369401 RepID=A0A1K2IP13_9FLAO|nr:glycan-binding surface protein [Flaviramulus basaltis]SFZ93435.1 Uncaracterized surface protein containing fasciclin (FAS1) repeats [Flaviramulus basaltis]